ncbi:COG4223 family protein [Pseudochrobactrum sp. MP213Fo]|uniref:COG4223 family protein n=1 Tax=Pseudochrobactrum sp. MP213Fo TaxID=3022250 RepID=UPI003B9DF053
MAKSTLPRHNKTSRKPVTIDLDPSDVKPVRAAGKPVPNAEPVGNFSDSPKTAAVADKKAPEAKVAEPHRPVQSARASSGASENGTGKASGGATADKTSNLSENLSGKTMNSASGTTAPVSKSASPWLAGLAGGIIVLLGTTALQWSGYGLISGQTTQNTDAEQALTAQVTRLEQQLTALQAAPAPKPDAELLARLEAAEKAAAQAQKLIGELPQTTATQTDGEDAALREALTQRLNAMETRLATTSTQAEQANAAASGDNQAVQDLKEQLAALQLKIENQASEQEKQPDMAAIVAVNALKAAIDRGGSYSNEYQTFSALAPETNVLTANLETMAAKGVPTLSQLNSRFAVLADQMVAVENKPAADAGIWEQLKGSAKGLVRSRPVGDVAGSGVGPVTARIEFALQNGDAERALTEWAQLPEAAKQIGQEFFNALTARRDADALVARLIAQTAQPAIKPAAE